MDPKTVTAGVDELDAGTVPLPPGRVRRQGAGRPRAEQTDPGLVPALLELVEPARRGDPMTTLCWTSLSTRWLAARLTAAGHWASHTTVSAHPDRDAQFNYLADRAADHHETGEPVISVDTKKKELVGNYKNNGREWAPAGTRPRVNVHDFIGEQGRANPYGVYDIGADTGWVSVGTSHDTPAFAVNTIGTWWQQVGRDRYPTATRLMITADGGGSNGSRVRAWKTEPEPAHRTGRADALRAATQTGSAA